MKFHLPVKLMTALMAAMVVSTAYGAKDSYNHSEYENFTHNFDEISSDVTLNVGAGDYSAFDMYCNTLDSNPAVDDSIIMGGATMQNVSYLDSRPENNGAANNVFINVNGGTGIKYILGMGFRSAEVTGIVNITVNSGSVDYIIGGVHYASSANAVASGAHNFVAKHDNDIRIVVNGGEVGSIRGGHNNSSSLIKGMVANLTEAEYESLMNNKPWSVGGNVTITVNGGTVGEILGSGGSSHSVDGNVGVYLQGGEVTENVCAGPRNILAEVGGNTTVSLVGDAVVKGSILAADIDDGDVAKGAAPTIKGDSYVYLSDNAVVEGDVLAGGRGSIVKGSTYVSLDGNAQVKGVISGLGEGATVNGSRVLTVEETYTGKHGHKVADFTDIQVNADVTLDQMSSAAEGTQIEIAEGATLTVADKENTTTASSVKGGTLCLDGASFELADASSALSSDVVMKNHAMLDLKGAAVTGNIVVYGCTLSGAGSYTGNLEVDGGDLTLTDPTCAASVHMKNDATVKGADLATNHLTVDTTGAAPSKPMFENNLTIHENGTITLNGGGVLIVSGSLTLGPNVSINLGGDYDYGDEAIRVTSGDINLADGVTLTYGNLVLELQGNSLVVVSLFDQEIANMLSAANWGIATASRSFVNTVRGQRTNTGCIADGRGTAWVSMLGGSHDVDGADIDIMGAAVGADMKVGEMQNLGFALGYVESEVKTGPQPKADQEGSYIALYGEHRLAKLGARSCIGMDWVATYGTTESKCDGVKWEQDSVQLNTRLNWNRKLTDRLCMNVFGGLEYFASESDTVDGNKTGSIQNLRGEIGAGVRYVAWGTPATAPVMDQKGAIIGMARPGCEKLVLHGEVRYMNDMVRSNPVIEMDGLRGTGLNPGRYGVGIEAGATYRIGERWSASANYGFNTMDDSREHRVNVGASYTF